MFRTDRPRVILCPSCKAAAKKKEKQKERKLAKKYRAEKKQTVVDIPLLELTAIIERYNREHKTHYTYGQFTMLLHNGEIKIER